MKRLVKLALIPAVLFVAALASAPSTADAGYGYGYGYGYRSHYIHRVYVPTYYNYYTPSYCAPVYNHGYGYGY
jgi:hypothetical protein